MSLAIYFLGGLIENVGGKATIVGVASFVTVGGCPIDKPVGFANVTNYLDWIHNITAEVELHPTQPKPYSLECTSGCNSSCWDVGSEHFKKCLFECSIIVPERVNEICFKSSEDGPNGSGCSAAPHKNWSYDYM